MCARNLPVAVQHLLNAHKQIVIYVSSQQALNDVYVKYNVHENLRNSSNHFNALGNKYYAQAVLNILKDHAWGRGGNYFQYDSTINGFISHGQP